MLILTRREGKAFFIGDDIKVVVTNIDYNRDQVSIGIEAPKDILILREELIGSSDEKSHPSG